MLVAIIFLSVMNCRPVDILWVIVVVHVVLLHFIRSMRRLQVVVLMFKLLLLILLTLCVESWMVTVFMLFELLHPSSCLVVSCVVRFIKWVCMLAVPVATSVVSSGHLVLVFVMVVMVVLLVDTVDWVQVVATVVIIVVAVVVDIVVCDVMLLLIVGRLLVQNGLVDRVRVDMRMVRLFVVSVFFMMHWEVMMDSCTVCVLDHRLWLSRGCGSWLDINTNDCGRDGDSGLGGGLCSSFGCWLLLVFFLLGVVGLEVLNPMIVVILPVVVPHILVLTVGMLMVM